MIDNADVRAAFVELARLMGEDVQKLEGGARNDQSVLWHGITVDVYVRSSWIEVFDIVTGHSLISVAVPNSEAMRLVRYPADGAGKGWHRFISEPAPLGFYLANNSIKHLLKE